MVSRSVPTHVVCACDEILKVCVAARNVNNRLQVYRGDRREAIVVPPKTVSTFELQGGENDTWFLWVAVEDGTIYRKYLQMRSSTHRCASQGDMKDDQYIFDELLQGKSKPDIVQVSEVTWLSKNDEVVKLTASGIVTKICCCNEYIIISSACRGEISIHLYPMSKLMSDKLCTPLIRFLLPCVRNVPSVCSQGISHHQSSLCFLATTEKAAISSSLIVLPVNLFSALFGAELAIRSISVLIWVSLSGAVHYRPADTFQSNSSEVDWCLLCDLGCPVVNICQIKIKRALSEKERIASELKLSLGLSAASSVHSLLDSLLVCGASGLCCILTTTPTADSTIRRSTRVTSIFTLPGAVQCCFSQGENLFFCDGRSIKRCTFILFSGPDGERDQCRVEVEYITLHAVSASAMWLARADRQDCDAAQEDTLIVQTSSGDMVAFDATEAVSEDNDSIVSSQCQPSLQELLVSIDINSSKLEQLQARHRRLNEFLQQMNIASRLLHFHHPAYFLSKDQAPVSCQLKVQSDIAYHGIQYFVVTKLVNNSPVVMTAEWSLTILRHQDVDYNEFSSLASSSGQLFPSSYTFSLDQGLRSGQCASFRIPVPHLAVYTPFTLQAMLTLHLPDEMKNPEDVKLLQCLFVPVCITVIDVFDFLQEREVDTPLLFPARAQTVDDFVDGLQHGRKISAENYPGSSAASSYTISEAVPDSFCKHFDITTPFSLISHIVSWTQIDTSTLKPSLASCSLQDPNGAILSLFVEKCVEPTTSDSLLLDATVSSFKVTLKSPSASLLAQARLALVRRLQSFTRVYKELTGHKIQKLMDTAEKLQKELDILQEDFTGSSHPSIQNIAAAYSLYEKMRSLLQ